MTKIKTSLNILSRIIEYNNRLRDHLFFYRLWENQYGWSFDQFTTIEENEASLRWSPWTQYNHKQQLSCYWQQSNWITTNNWTTNAGEPTILQPSSLQEMVQSTLFYLQRKNVIWLLRRILSQTPLVWRARGVWHKSLEEPDSAQIKERSLLGHFVCSEETQKRFWSRMFSIFWNLSHRDRCSVQSFSFKVCIGLLIKNGEGETLSYWDPMPFWRF